MTIPTYDYTTSLPYDYITSLPAYTNLPEADRFKYDLSVINAIADVEKQKLFYEKMPPVVCCLTIAATAIAIAITIAVLSPYIGIGALVAGCIGLVALGIGIGYAALAHCLNKQDLLSAEVKAIPSRLFADYVKKAS